MYLRVDLKLVGSSTWDQAVVARGVGNVVRSIVLLTMILCQGYARLELVIRTMLRVAGRRRDSSKRSTVLGGIVLIVGSGGSVYPLGKQRRSRSAKPIEPRFAVVVRGVGVMNQVVIADDPGSTRIVP